MAISVNQQGFKHGMPVKSASLSEKGKKFGHFVTFCLVLILLQTLRHYELIRQDDYSLCLEEDGSSKARQVLELRLHEMCVVCILLLLL